jgi:hypothetical protein
MYFVLERFFAKHPARWIAESPFIRDGSFTLGERIAVQVPDPLRFSLAPLNLNANDMGPDMPEYMKGSIPLFRDDLVKAMRDGGVDNLDLYNAVIIDPDGGTQHTNYKAVNIIGAIAAADMAKSDAVIHTGGPFIDVDFYTLVLDEKRAGDALIFRLAEATSAILVHERLRDHLLSRGYSALEFLNPRECAF